MNSGKTLFAQVMEFVPWTSFTRIVDRYSGDARVSALPSTEHFGPDVDIAGKVYALDSSAVDLCLSLFDWAPFRSTKAAIKLHTLLDLRGCIPSFIHISNGKMHDVNVLDILAIEAGAFCHGSGLP